MRPVRGYKKSLGSHQNIIGSKKAAKKIDAVQIDNHAVIEEFDDEEQKLTDYAKLTPVELNLTHTKTLVAVNPQAEPNKIMYDYLERKNKINDSIDQLVMHFNFEGDYTHTSTGEYRVQEEI
eukprot:GHVR01021681.1.p1 GENE.GHVR01021681.1~~GHVR01021681.1.p1  ORF type:complete len:122 (-),score=17.63 GHVR01021681.1:1651-2016(-)